MWPKIFNKSDSENPIACTEEAMLCPDGITYVGRTGPNCEFARCPDQQIVGGDKDEHGCIGSAGYSWCEPKSKCLRIWEEACYASAEEEIKYLLAKKYNKLISDVSIKANKSTADYMSGGVFFSAPDLPSSGPGGAFLAAKTGNVWTLVFDGNGSINCEEIKSQYSFPADMLKGFCD